MDEIRSTDSLEEKKHPLLLRGIATTISYIFHPVFLPPLMTYILYVLAPVSFAGSNKPISFIVLQVGLLTSFFSILTVFLAKGLGFIESIHLRNPKERIIPLMTSMIFYFWAYWVFKNNDAPFILRVLLLGGFWGIIAVFMINIFFKISMHTAGAGSILGILVVLMALSPVNLTLALFFALFIAGLIGTSRMILKAHKGPEIWSGYIVGFIVQVSAYWYLT